MNTMMREVKRFVSAHEPEMVAQLKSWVEINSYTSNKPGVDCMGESLREALEATGLAVDVVPQATVGDHLVARSAACSPGEKSLLLCGHFDTVFPQDSGFQACEVSEARIAGPGTVDMKAGLMTAIYALRALRHVGVLDEIPVVMVCNSDEETGSVTSTPCIAEEARRAVAAFVFEGGGLRNDVVVGRKGKLSCSLRIYGESGHAGNVTVGKVSAILECAHCVLACERWNDPERQCSVNVGLIRGGVQANVVADRATAHIDCRFVDPADEARLTAQLTDLTRHPHVPGATLELQVLCRRPPMPTTPAIRGLYDRLQGLASELELPPVRAQVRGGVSDANGIAALGVPVLDGLGPIGDGDHSPGEHIVRSSLTERTALAALMLYETWRCRDEGVRG